MSFERYVTIGWSFHIFIRQVVNHPLKELVKVCVPFRRDAIIILDFNISVLKELLWSFLINFNF